MNYLIDGNLTVSFSKYMIAKNMEEAFSKMFQDSGIKCINVIMDNGDIYELDEINQVHVKYEIEEDE